MQPRTKHQQIGHPNSIRRDLTPAPVHGRRPLPAYDFAANQHIRGLARVAPGIRVSRSAEAGGNLPALGYIPPGTLTPQGAAIYNALIAAGETPQHALNVARGLANKSAGEIDSILRGAAAGGAAGSVGLALGCLLCIPIGAAVGAIAGAIGGLFGGGSPDLSGVGRPQNQPRQFQRGPQPEGDGADLEHQLIGAAISQAPRAVSAISQFLKGLFGGSAPNQGEEAPDNLPPANPLPAPQPYFPAPNTEVLPSLTGPNAQPTPTPTYAYPGPQPGYDPYQSELQPLGHQPLTPIDIGPQPQPYQQPQIQRTPAPQPSQYPNEDLVNRLRDQLTDEIRVEQHQDATQKAHQIRNQLGDIKKQLDDLRQLEKQPADQRNIPQELRQKQQLQDQLNDLDQRSRDLPQDIQPTGSGPISFCVTCDDEQDALFFMNGEGDGASCTVTSQDGGGGSRMYQAPPSISDEANRIYGETHPQDNPAYRRSAVDAYGNPLNIYTPPAPQPQYAAAPNAGGFDFDPALDPNLQSALASQFTPDAPDLPDFTEPGLTPSIYDAANRGFADGQRQSDSDPRGDSERNNPYGEGTSEARAYEQAFIVGDPN